MEEVRVNVRSRGGSSGKPDFEVLHPSSCRPSALLVSTSLPSLTNHPCLPALSHCLFLPRSRRPPGTGVASRRSRRRRRRWLAEEESGRRGLGLALSLDQYSHLLLAGPDRTLRSEAYLLANIKLPFL